MHRDMWHDEQHNALKWWDSVSHTWRKYFENEFRITSEILTILPPSSPVPGQLWIHNGVLCYYDGANWNPIKALLQDGSQFSLDVFRNFILVSPLWKIGNTIVRDEDIETYKKLRREYLQGILNLDTGSMATGDGTKWTFDHVCDADDGTIPELQDAAAQLLVPEIDYDRVFLNHTLDTEKYKEVSKVCIQYQKSDLVDAVPSLIHLNPGRITDIRKRLFLIDRENPRIQIPAGNTEFYGFQKGNPLGDLLLPDQEDENYCDYTIVADGILLSRNAAQNYDYVLAISYEFSWMKTTGTLAKVNSLEASNSFYIDDYKGPMNVFINGYDLEDPYFTEDGYSRTITIHEDTTNLEVLMLHSPAREYGYVRNLDVNSDAIIRPLKGYQTPLLFVNGQAMEDTLDQISWNEDGAVTIPGAKIGMMWSIIDLTGPEENGEVLFTAPKISGTISRNRVINYEENRFPFEKSDNPSEYAVLFINGLLVRKEDLTFNQGEHYITILDEDGNNVLQEGQQYILIFDKYGWLYKEEDLIPALSVGKFSDSLVYMNGHLLCNGEALDTFA